MCYTRWYTQTDSCTLFYFPSSNFSHQFLFQRQQRQKTSQYYPPPFFFFLWEANRSKTVLIHGEKSEGSTWDPVSSRILPFKPVLILNPSSLVVQLVNNPPARQIPAFDPWVGKIPWRRERLTAPVFWPAESQRDMTEWLSLHFNLIIYINIIYIYII